MFFGPRSGLCHCFPAISDYIAAQRVRVPGPFWPGLLLEGLPSAFSVEVMSAGVFERKAEPFLEPVQGHPDR
jgi:hypothetical protein